MLIGFACRSPEINLGLLAMAESNKIIDTDVYRRERLISCLLVLPALTLSVAFGASLKGDNAPTNAGRATR